MQESCRFVDQACTIIRAINECIKCFNDPSKQKTAFEQLAISMSPLNADHISTEGQNLGAKRALTTVC
jgi:hypothetical protein